MIKVPDSNNGIVATGRGDDGPLVIATGRDDDGPV